MNLRITQKSIFQRVLFGLRTNQRDMLNAQEQVSTGSRVNRPSDDPTAALRIVGLERRFADAQRLRAAIQVGSVHAGAAANALQDASGLITEARGLMIQGMNGTLNDDDRATIAERLELIRLELVELGNRRVGDRFLFGGLESDAAPFGDHTVGGYGKVAYAGDGAQQQLRIGEGVTIPVNLPGSAIFASLDPFGLTFSGMTGLGAGTTASEGAGYERVVVRHDATDPGNLASVGIALVNGGAGDTFVGMHGLVIDATAGTIQLGGGPVLSLPPDLSGGAAAAFTVTNAQGGELVLDLSGFTGVDYAGSVSGSASIAIEGQPFQPLDFSETDLRLANDATGNVLHVDLTGVGRAGIEVVQFGGAIDLFDVLEGAAKDLRNGDLLANPDVLDRLELRLGEFDRHQSRVIASLGILGARGERLQNAELRSASNTLEAATAISDVRDADFAEVVLALQRAEATLQLAQASGARLLSQGLLQFLR
ncbi:MAG TPA: flagellar hook-associated protein FlgL [Planctomycetota bacterium]|nr:flagellar hook-associated protein FlgL [Planctomycetota bacterium]